MFRIPRRGHFDNLSTELCSEPDPAVVPAPAEASEVFGYPTSQNLGPRESHLIVMAAESFF